MITCVRCGEDKPDGDFSPSNRERTTPWCRACYRDYNAERWAKRTPEQINADRERAARYKQEHREELNVYYREWNAARPGYKRTNRLMREYGITPDDFDRMLDEQGGLCAICLQPPTGQGRNGRRLHIDHCHATGHVRGLLCGKCNTAMGQLADDPERMQRMIKYLEERG